MSNARKLADNLPTVGQLGNRNLIINGAMEVAQRGTSSTSYGYVSLDRWYVNQSGGSTTFSQETNSNPSETGGLQKYARLNVSSSSDYTGIFQRIEDVTSVPEGTVTISFYAKGTAPTGGVKVWATQVFGSGGSSDVNIAEQVIASSLTSSWVRYTLNMTVPSVDGKTIGANSNFLISIGQGTDTASTAYDLNITGIQLEVGSQSTPFEHELYDTTIRKCGRYYQRITADAGFDYGAIGIAVGTSSAWYVPLPLKYGDMRVDPTLSYSAVGNFRITLQHSSSSTCTSLGIGYNHTDRPMLSVQAGSNSAGSLRLFGFSGASSGWIAFDAEL